MPIIEFYYVSKKYKTNSSGDFFHFKLDDFVIDENKIYVLLGPNGAGKSTFIKLLLNLILPDAGIIRIFNIPNKNKKSRMNIGFLPEDYSFPERYSFYEAAYYFGLCKLSESKLLKNNIMMLCDKLNLTHLKKKRIDKLSKGMLQSLGLLHALIGDNKLLILDEPFNGLDPVQKKYVLDYIIQLNRENGITVLLTTHILTDIESIGDEIMIINNGVIANRSSKEIIKNNYRTIEEYYFSYFTK